MDPSENRPHNHRASSNGYRRSYDIYESSSSGYPFIWDGSRTTLGNHEPSSPEFRPRSYNFLFSSPELVNPIQLYPSDGFYVPRQYYPSIEAGYSHCGFSRPAPQQLQDQQQREQNRRRLTNLILLKGKQNTEAALQQCVHVLSSEPVVLKKKQREESRRIHILPLFPIENLYKTFEYLDATELFRLASTCNAWRDFMVAWPTFWKKFRDTYPELKKTTLESLILRHDSPQQLYFDLGPYNMLSTYIVALFEDSPNSHKIQKILFDYFNLFPSESKTCLVSAVKKLRSIKEIEFRRCSYTQYDDLNYILQQCSKAKRISIHYTGVAQYGTYIDQDDSPTGYDFPDNGVLSLTYLKVTVPINMDDQEINPRTGFYIKCPNLRHLFLDALVLVRYVSCIVNRILKFCPKLENLIVNDDGIMPTTSIVTDIDDICGSSNNNSNDNYYCYFSSSSFSKMSNRNSLYCTSPSLQPKQQLLTNFRKDRKLRRIVFSNKQIDLLGAHGRELFDYSSHNIELLYLHRQLKTDHYYLAFRNITRYDWTSLREINLSFNIYDNKHFGRRTMNMVLVNLFPRFQKLEAITIDSLEKEDMIMNDNSNRNSRNRNSNKSFNICLNDEVLKCIAECCPLVRHLYILGEHAITDNGVLHFSKIGGTKLTHMELNMTAKPLLQVVKNLKALKQLRIQKRSVLKEEDHHNGPLLPSSFGDEQKMAKDILSECGGSLTIT